MFLILIISSQQAEWCPGIACPCQQERWQMVDVIQQNMAFFFGSKKAIIHFAWCQLLSIHLSRTIHNIERFASSFHMLTPSQRYEWSSPFDVSWKGYSLQRLHLKIACINGKDSGIDCKFAKVCQRVCVHWNFRWIRKRSWWWKQKWQIWKRNVCNFHRMSDLWNALEISIEIEQCPFKSVSQTLVQQTSDWISRIWIHWRTFVCKLFESWSPQTAKKSIQAYSNNHQRAATIFLWLQCSLVFAFQLKVLL